MKYAFLLISFLLSLQPRSAKADGWVVNVIHAAGDVVTLCETCRTRDRNAADEAKRRAEDAERAAKIQRDTERHGYEQLGIEYGAERLRAQQTEKALIFLRDRLKYNLNLSSKLVMQIEATDLRASALKEVLKSQQDDLRAWTQHLTSSTSGSMTSTEAPALAAIQNKVAVYFQQIENVPVDGVENIEEVMRVTLGVGSECIRIMDELIGFKTNEVSKIELKIGDNDAHIKAIQ